EATSPGIGQGSEFIVRLPLAGDAPQGSDARAAASTLHPEDHKAGKRILVVDDNRDSAHSLTMLFRLLGNDVREAHDGQQAVQVLSEFVPDLLLLDIALPGMTGYEVARTVRSQERFRRVRIVALSGYGSDEDRARSLDAGFDEHLVKPVEFGTLE